MGEYDNAEFPLLYCFKPTASSIELGKQKWAVTAWAECVHEVFDIHPQFTHVDEDTGENREILDA